MKAEVEAARRRGVLDAHAQFRPLSQAGERARERATATKELPPQPGSAQLLQMAQLASDSDLRCARGP